MDIDLDRLVYTPEQLALLADREDWSEMTVALPEGFLFEGVQTTGGTDQYESFKDINFNEFTFRQPTLGDAIKYEKNFGDTIMFWRKIAWDCLTKMNSTDAACELPIAVKNVYSLKLFNEQLMKDDLEAIREKLRDDIPMLPFVYEEECPQLSCRKMTPVAVEPQSFFSA